LIPNQQETKRSLRSGGFFYEFGWSSMDTLNRFTKFLRPYRSSLLWIMVFLVLEITFELSSPIIQKLIIDEVIVKKDVTQLLHLLVILLVLYALKQIFNYLQNYYRHVLGGQFILDLRVRLYSYLQKLSLSYFEKISTGELMSRVTNDVNALENFVTHGAAFLLVAFLRLAGAVVILLVLNWKLALLVFIPMPVIAVALRMFNNRIRPVYRNIRARLGDINSKLQDNLSGIRVIQIFRQEEKELNFFKQESTRYFNAQVDAIKLWSSFFPAMGFLSSISTILVLGVGSWMVMNQQLSLGSLVAFISYMVFLFDPINRLIDIDNVFQEAIAAGERIFEVLDQEATIKDTTHAVPLENVKGKIEFHKVSFSYQSDERVLEDVSFTINPGETVALIGPSGAGKSSIANLICRFYDPEQGSIKIDNQNLQDLLLSDIRSQIGIVLQDTFLFNSTIRENLVYGNPDVSETEMIEAAKTAYAHDFIMELSNRYDTEIGERGIKLSGGQKQRLALARAILMNPKIIILDEATSSVDAEAEYLIQQALDAVLKNRSALVIAHRLSTIRNADKIIAIDQGKIVEIGNHETLIKQNGLYKKLVEKQLSYSI
jgi:subfamily B ATP-binding cassette protein MsbA